MFPQRYCFHELQSIAICQESSIGYWIKFRFRITVALKMRENARLDFLIYLLFFFFFSSRRKFLKCHIQLSVLIQIILFSSFQASVDMTLTSFLNVCKYLCLAVFVMQFLTPKSQFAMMLQWHKNEFGNCLWYIFLCM